MCGIAGAYLRDPKLSVDLDGLLNTMLKSIQHRGGDATGFVALDSKGVAEWHRAACDVRDFLKYRRPVPTGTRIVLAHTRWATQGLPAFIENNHPIRRGSFYVIHNGHVSNDQELFKLSGRERFAQVDSEAIPARLASLGSLDKLGKVAEEIEGAAAIAAVDSKNPKHLALARGHSSPLHVLVTDKIVLWGSTQDTVKAAYKKHIGRLPKRVQIESVPEGTLLMVYPKSVVRSTFKPYQPRTFVYTKVWEDDDEIGDRDGACSVPKAERLPLPTVAGWPKWDDVDEGDLIECDVCSARLPWQEMTFEDDKSSDYCWTLCSMCKDVNLDVFDIEGVETEVVSDDLDVVNAAILDEDEQ